MADDNSKDNNNEPVPANFAGVLAQVNKEIQKGKTGAVKQQVQELLKKRDEHERSIRQINIQLDDIKAKFEAGV